MSFEQGSWVATASPVYREYRLAPQLQFLRYNRTMRPPSPKMRKVLMYDGLHRLTSFSFMRGQLDYSESAVYTGSRGGDKSVWANKTVAEIMDDMNGILNEFWRHQAPLPRSIHFPEGTLHGNGDFVPHDPNDASAVDRFCARLGIEKREVEMPPSTCEAWVEAPGRHH